MAAYPTHRDLGLPRLPRTRNDHLTNRSTGCERPVGGEHEADRDGAGGQRVLRLRATRVERRELAGLEVVRGLKTRLAERTLRALRRPTEHGRGAGALLGELREGLHTVLVGE